MADSVDRVFGHALNTVNKIRPGSTKPPSADRLALYGLYKQSMEGDVTQLYGRPTASTPQFAGTSSETLKKEQEKWDAWKANAGLSRTEAKRRYIEKLIQTMHDYASGTDEARQLVEELEFVWDQIKSNSQHSSGDSERSSPLQNLERSGYISSSGNGHGVSSSAAALEPAGNPGRDSARGGAARMRVLSPVSQAEEEDETLEEKEEFVDARVSQVDAEDFGHASEAAAEGQSAQDSGYAVLPRPQQPGEARWRKRVESSLMKLTTEVAALREQLETRRFFAQQRKHSILGWVLRLSWWAVQLVVADAVVLFFVLWYLRRKKDRRLEGAIRVLLGDAKAQVQRVGREVKMPSLPKLSGRKPG